MPLLTFINKSRGRIELVYFFIVHKQRLVIRASALETAFIVIILSLWYVGCRSMRGRGKIIRIIVWQRLAFCRCCCVNEVIGSVSQVK